MKQHFQPTLKHVFRNILLDIMVLNNIFYTIFKNTFNLLTKNVYPSSKSKKKKNFFTL